jgi:HEAT repeat protein
MSGQETKNSKADASVFRNLRLGWITGVALVLLLVLALVVGLISRKPWSLYWSGRKFSLSLQALTPKGPFADEGWWVRNGWDGPTGEFTHGQLYGLKFGKRLLRLDIVDDPIAAIKRQLPNTIPGLLEALTSKDHLVKKCAGEALVKWGPSAQSALPILLKRFKQGDEEVEWIILELAKAAGASAVPPLLDALVDVDSKLRQKSAEALGEIGADAKLSVPKLTQALHDSAPAVVLTSALSLRKIEKHDHGEVSALIGLLTHNDPQVRGGAACALAEFGEDAGEAVQPLMKLLKNSDPDSAGLAARTLGLIGPSARPAIPLLIASLNTGDEHALMFSMEALGHFGEDAKAAIPKLLELAEKREQAWGAISALSSMGTDAMPGLVVLYRDGEHAQRFQAARAFMRLGPKAAAAVPALVEDLTPESSGRAAWAALVLAGIGEDAKVAVPRLIELTHDDDVNVRLRAAEALWRLDRRTNAVLPVMVAELTDWSKDHNALLGRTSDEQDQSRQEVAAEVLGEIGPAAKEAVPLLRMMLRSSFDSQKESAAKALEKIEP